MNSNPWLPMTTGTQNSHSVTLNGQTKTVKGATSGLEAARKAFGSDGDKATAVKTQTVKG